MESYVSCTEAARLAGADAPRRISDLFYRGELDTEKCPMISGRRAIPLSYVPEIRKILRQKGLLKTDRQAVAAEM